MTAKQVADWKIERDIARSISDPDERAKALEKVYDHKDDMMLECIQHQADRIKTGLANDSILDKEIKGVKSDVATLKAELKPCVESDKDYRSWKLKIQGGILLCKFLKYASAAVGGGVILKLLQAYGNA